MNLADWKIGSVQCPANRGGRAFAAILCFLLLPALLQAGMVNGVVVDRSKRPIAGAHVRVVTERPVYLLPEELKPLAEAWSDEQGRFQVRVDEETTERLSLLASAPGHRPARFVLDASHFGRTVGLRLSPGAAVEVLVKDRNGKPVPGAVAGPLLPVRGGRYDTGSSAVPQWGTSDAGGIVHFDGVDAATDHKFLLRAPGCLLAEITIPAGQRSLSTTMAEGGSTVMGRITAAGVPESELGGLPVRLTGNSLEVTVPSDRTGGFVMDGVPPGDYTLEALPRDGRASRAAAISLPQAEGTTWTLEVSSGYSISGTAVDAESGMPVPFIPLLVKPRQEGPQQEVLTGSEGTFTAGPFFIAGTPMIEPPVKSGYKALSSLGEAAADIPVADGFQSLSGIEVKLRRSREVRVTLNNFEMTTESVALTLLGGGAQGGRMLRRLEGSTATVELLAGGDYRCYGISGGLATPIVPFQVGDEPEVAAELTLEPAAELRGRILMRTEDGGTTAARGFSVSLLVQGPGAPGGVAGDRLAGSLEEQTELAGRLIGESASPAADGSYSFSALPFGTVEVLVRHHSNSRSEIRQIQLASGATVTADFLFEPGQSLRGKVADSAGKPVAGARIAVSLTGGALGELKQVTLQSDANGHFQAEDLEGSTASRISVSQHGYFPKVLGPISLPASNVEVELVKRGFLRATVNAAGDTFWDVYCMGAVPWKTGAYPEQLMSWPGSTAKGVRGGEACELTIHGEGRYRVVAVGPAKELAVSAPFAWAAEDSADREVKVTPGETGNLTGSYPGEEPMQITAWNTSLPEEAIRRVEFKQNAEGGRFSFGTLPPGDYLLTAEGEQGTASAANVQVVPAQTTAVTLETEIAVSTVRGTVRSEDKGIADAGLELASRTDSSLPVHTVRSGSDGSFVFENVPADEYVIKATLVAEGKTLETQRAVQVTRRGEPDPVILQFSGGREITILPAELADLQIQPGAEILFISRETGAKVEVEWIGGNEKARVRLAPGDYDIYVGPMPMGRGAVSADGSFAMAPESLAR